MRRATTTALLLAEARSRLEGLISLSEITGPQPILDQVQQKLSELGVLRTTVFEEPAPPAFAPIPEPVRIKGPTPVPLTQPVIRKRPEAPGFNPERYVPYRVLWAKVIIRAAYDYALWKDSRDLRLRKFAQDAERWLFESSNLELSFENICFAFDFPVERIRRKTRALTKQDVKKLEFRERHGRIVPPELLGDVNGGDD